jgi:cytoskeleton protein RodZ
MTEESDQIGQTERTTPRGDTLSLEAVGRLLVESREKAGLTVDEVASRLRLMPRQVLALESGNADALPGPAFVRGFLRNYAKLLQLDAEPLLEACRAHGPDTSVSQISLHSENILIAGRQRRGWTVYLTAIVVVVVALAAWFAYMDYNRNAGTPAPTEPADISQALPEANVLPPGAPMPPATEGTLPMPAVPAVIPEPLPETQPAAPQAAGEGQLMLAPAETSWISVRDRDNKEILGRNITGGSSETINAMPPLKLVIGNASTMQLTYNGKPVDLAPHIKANVARLTLE